MRTGKWIAVWFAAWLLESAAAFGAPQAEIRFVEPIELPATAGTAQFDAYGRRFVLTLENNDRLFKAIPAARKAELDPARVLRGKIEGVAGSWVRLTRVGNSFEGAIWDGTDMYVVTRYERIVGNLTTPIVAVPAQTVVYRLSDVRNGLPPEFCGLADTGAADLQKNATALTQYKGLVDGLRANAIATLDDELDISLIADRAFQTLPGITATDAMLARLNVVDGIFAEQVGVVLIPTEFRLVPANADPFTLTNAEGLLGQLAAFRESTPAVRAAGLAHLVTGKNLDGNTIGIAFLDSLCDAREGVSLSDSEEGEFFSALVMAHEIGHNFGARHDGEPGVCASTPATYLMSPELNNSTQFSACSLNSMRSSIASARGVCIGSAHYVDLDLGLPPSPYTVQTNGTFSLPMTVRSNGTLPASHVQLQVAFPPYFGMNGATLAGANCSFASSVITCALDDFTAGEQRALDLRVTGNALGTFPVQVTLTADNEFITSNNSGVVQVGVRSGVDLGVAITASAPSVYVTDPVDFTVDLASHGTLASHGGFLSINIGGIPIASFTAGPHACAIDSSSNYILLCQLADIAAQGTSRITVRGYADQPRNGGGGVYLNLPYDSDETNNSATVPVVVSAEREVRTRVSGEELRAVVGTSYELTYTLTTLGRLPAQNVLFSVSQPPGGIIESVAIAGVTCTTTTERVDCALGSLNPGDVRTAVVRFHINSRFTTYMSAATLWGNRTGNEYSSAYTWVYANLTIDVAASTGNFFPIDEGVIGSAGFSVETKGVDPAQNATATIELEPPLRLLGVSFYNGPPGWTCELQTPQRGRCTGAFPGGTRADQTFATMQYTFVSDTAVIGLATVTVDAANDGDPTNNVAQLPLEIRPYVDIGVSAPNPSRLLVTGETTVVEATITTGKNPVPGARVTPWASDASLALDSITVAGVDCAGTTSGTPCNLGTLPANASLAVRAVFRAVTGGAAPYAVIDVYPDRDSNTSNNHLAIPIYTLDPSDIQLSIAQTSATAVNGNLLSFPRITVTNGAAVSRDVRVEIPLPPFVTVSGVSAGAFCTGTTTLDCLFLNIAPNNTMAIDLSLNTTGTGTFTSNVTMSAANDATPGNNSGSVELTVTAPSSGGGSSSGGGGSSSGGGGSSSGAGSSSSGGGGGRFEWLTLALLGAIAASRAIEWGQTRAPRSAPSPPADCAPSRR